MLCTIVPTVEFVYVEQYECDICPEGSYCLPVDVHNASLNVQPCPAGYYCPAGTGMLVHSCFNSQIVAYKKLFI